MGKSRQNKSKQPPTKFPMGQQIYNQIVWDNRLDARQFHMLYQDRRGTIKSKGLLSWDPGGDIPWHRLVAIEHNGRRIWDREARINDLPTLLHNPPVDTPTSPQAEGQFEHIPTYHYDATIGDWLETRTPQTPIQRPLRVLCWNVLFDLYDDSVVDSPSRWPSICATLQTSEADIIVLVEMTPTFWAHLLEEPWLQEHYHVSDDLLGQTIDPYGQVILSREPMALMYLQLTEHKRAVMARMGQNALSVCAVHLPSGRTEHAHERRRQQLNTLSAQLQDEDNLLILGDTNLRDGELDDALALAQWTDIWQMSHGQQSGETYKPSVNALAAHTSQSQEDARYDRALIKYGSAWHVAQMRIPAQRKINNTLPASDHEPIELTILPEALDLNQLRTTVHTACTITLPESNAEQVQVIRQKADKSFERWMPHINVMYPFVPATHFAYFAMLARETLDQLAPFETQLTTFETFTHAKSHTVWLDPQPNHPIKAVQQHLEEHADVCKQHRAQRHMNYQPHMSVAQFARTQHDQMRQHIQKWQSDWSPERFVVGDVALIQRTEKAPFHVTYRLPLGTRGGIEAVMTSLEAQNKTSHIALEALEQLGKCLPTNMTIEDIGSTRVGTELPDSDIDLIIAGPHDAQEGLSKVAEHIQKHTKWTNINRALDAKVPTLRCQIRDVDVDIAWAKDSAQQTDGVLMARWVTQQLQGMSNRKEVINAIKFMKHWAKTQQVYGTAWGYWGGISWTLAVLWVASSNEQSLNTHELLVETFARLSLWQWPLPLGQNQALQHRAAHMPVMSPLDEHINTTRAMTAATAHVMRAHLRRGWMWAQRIERGIASWQSTLEDRPARPAQAIVLNGPGEFIQPNILALLLDLEHLGHVRIYPDPIAPQTWCIGLHQWSEQRWQGLDRWLAQWQAEQSQGWQQISLTRQRYPW